MWRFLILVLFLGLLVIVPFLIWGQGMEHLWTIAKLESFGSWAWLVGLALLVGDLLIPVPSTVIMSGLGYVYGVTLGGVLASLGALGSAVTGYTLCRWMGEPMAARLAGERGLNQGRSVFDRCGSWLVALSRWLPVLAEVIACLAGMTRMSRKRFLFAASCGCIPMGFAFAWVGHLGERSPGIALAVSALAPPLLWFLVGRRLTLQAPESEGLANTAASRKKRGPGSTNPHR